MRPSPVLGFCGWTAFLILGAVAPVSAGQLTWNPGAVPPALILSLGDGTITRTLELPSGADSLDLTLKLFLLDDPRLVLVWKNDGREWFRRIKKIPGDSSTDRVALPPGRLVTLEISTVAGTTVAVIKLRRN